MRILVERSGGFAGIKRKAAVDSQALSEDAAAEMKQLVEAAGLFDLPAAPVTPPGGADQFQYNLTVEAGERRRTIELRDPACAEVARLLDWLWAHQTSKI
jgi:hypothetical protein